MAAAVCVAALGWMQSGCTTDAFCFDNCEGATSGRTTAAAARRARAARAARC